MFSHVLVRPKLGLKQRYTAVFIFVKLVSDIVLNCVIASDIVFNCAIVLDTVLDFVVINCVIFLDIVFHCVIVQI